MRDDVEGDLKEPRRKCPFMDADKMRNSFCFYLSLIELIPTGPRMIGPGIQPQKQGTLIE